MRHLTMRLAVALYTVVGFASCAVEHEEDGENDLGVVVDLGECDCEVKAVIWVNSLEGGIITCNGESWTYTQGARVYPICLDPEGEGFTVHVKANGETWIEGWVISDGIDSTPAYFEWAGGGAAASWPNVLASKVHLPNGGTLDAIVPEAQPD